MIGLVLTAHGDLAKGFLQATQMIVGEQESVGVIALREGMSPDELRGIMKNKIEEVDTGRGVLILADLFCGTPANIALEFTKADNVRLVAGVNLGIILEATQMRSSDLPLDEMAEQLCALGKDCIKAISLSTSG